MIWIRESLVAGGLCLLAMSGAACATPDSNAEDARKGRAETIIQEEIAARLKGIPQDSLRRALSGGFPDSVRFSAESSRVVRGLRYVQGSFVPANTYDVGLLLTAGETADRAVLLNSPQDWAALVSATGWRVTSGEDAIQACREVVAFVIPGPKSVGRPLIYEDSSTIRDSTGAIVATTEQGRIWARAAAPTVSGESRESVQVAELWAVETDRTAKYQCRFAKAGANVELSVRVVDSLPCSGQLASCE